MNNIFKLTRGENNNMLDLSIIIVNYNVKDLLKACLTSVYHQAKGFSFEVFVVDNASSDGSADMVAEEFPNVKLIRNEDNLGFSKANNVGIKQSKGNNVLLLNPDTIVLNNALQKMIYFLENHPEVGIVGPELLNPDGSVQFSSKNYFPFMFDGLLISHIVRKFFKTREFAHSHITEQTCWVIGSCLMVKRKILEIVGLLNEHITFFFEDADLCLRVTKAGFKVFFIKEANIIHYGGASWKQLDNPFLIGRQSLYQFFRIHKGQLYANCFKALTILDKIIVSFIYMVIPKKLREKKLGNDYEHKIKYFLRIGSFSLPNSPNCKEVNIDNCKRDSSH